MENMKEILSIKQILSNTNNMQLQYVNNAYSVVKWLQEEFSNESQEVFILLCLNTKNKVTHYSVVHRGSINQSIASPRDIFLRAILNNSSRILVSHVHPSGDVEPSKQDDIFTENLVKGGEILGIPVLDHIIIGQEDYYSYRAYEKIK